MTNEELKTGLAAFNAALTFEEGEWVNIIVPPQDWLAIAQKLREDENWLFDYLFCVTGIDWKTHLTVVYHLTSTKYRHTIVVKSKLDRNNPEIESVASLWKTAEFHEREAYDLLGIKFLNHPDLRRLFLTEEWVGFPLRKDYDDPVNMIKL